MLRIGLTGNIASGKSMVARRLEELGAVIIDADRIGHELIGPGGACRGAVVQAFGPGILGAGGGVDRGRLGRIVFSDPAELRRLNSLVHPPLVAAIRRRMAELESAGAAVVVLDAALLFEFGLAGEFRPVVVVTSPPAERVARLVERGLDPAEAARRVAAQGPDDDKVRRADRVLMNDRTPRELAALVAELWQSTGAAALVSHEGKDRPR